MKRTLTAIVLALLLVVPSVQAEEAPARYFFQAEELGFDLYLDPLWQDMLMTDQTVYLATSYDYDENEETVTGGEVMFFYPLDPSAPDPDSDPVLAGAEKYYAGEEPRRAGDEGFSYRNVYTDEDCAIAVTWYELSSQPLPEDAPVEKLESLVSSFRDSDELIKITLPSDTLGDFITTDLDGNEVTSRTLFEESGAKLTLVNAWATYCEPCLHEMPYLAELAAEYADKGVQIVGIPTDILDFYGNIDEDQLELARRYVEATGADYPHLIPDEVMNENLLRSEHYVPRSWFIGPDGFVIGDIISGSRSKEGWAALIDEHLALVQE